jgi:predicted RecA/RadA family phage recombinase
MKNKVQDGKLLHLTVGAAIVSGDPVMIGDAIAGIAQTSYLAADGKAVIDTEGVFDLSVNAVDDNGASAVGIGDRLYYDGTTTLSKKTSGKFFGVAQEIIASGTATINVKVGGSGVAVYGGASPSKIYVDTEGSNTEGDGSIFAPYATLTKAFSLVTTTRKKVIINAGEYDEVAAVVWPNVNGVELICPNGTAVIKSTTSVTHIIGINPAAAAATWSATLSDIEIENSDGQIGLQVDNATVGKRINLYLKNFAGAIDGDTPGASIDINRTGASGDAIRVYADGNGTTIEGLVTVITESTDDRFRFKGYRLIGGLTVVGAVACEVTLINTGLSAKTLDGANKLTNIGCWYETDANPNVYTNLANAFATY